MVSGLVPLQAVASTYYVELVHRTALLAVYMPSCCAGSTCGIGNLDPLRRHLTNSFGPEDAVCGCLPELAAAG